MRRIVSVLATVCFLVSSICAQVLTVGNSNSYNEFVPLCYRAWNHPQHGQVLYPENLLTEMQGKYISAITLYYRIHPGTYTPIHLDGKQTIKIGTTDMQNLSSDFATDSLTVVWEGCMEDFAPNGFNTDGYIELFFKEAFLYEGGNIVVDLYSTDAATNGWYHFFWYGENCSTALSRSYNSLNGTDYYTSAEMFLPQTTFKYQESSCVFPSLLREDDVTTSAATLSWNHVFSDSDIVNDYEVAIKRDEDYYYDYFNAYDTFLSLTSLDWSTDYHWKVRALCDANGESSEWSPERVFRTETETASLPYFCDFENTQENNAWNIINSSYFGWYIDTASFYNGEKSLYISKDGGTSVANITNYDFDNSWAFRDIYLDPAFPKYRLSFEHKGQCKLYVYIGPPAGNPYDNVPTGATTLTSGAPASTEWQTLSYTITNSNSGLQRLYFRFSRGGSGSMGASIDNVTIEGVSCDPPYNLSASVADSSAVLSWQHNCVSAPQSYIVAYKEEAENDFTELTVTDTFLTLNGLTPYTDYNWKVRSIFAPYDSSDFSQASTFKTEATPVRNLPYYCDFEDLSENAGWTLVPMTGRVNKWTIGTGAKASGQRSIYISNNSSGNQYSSANNDAIVWAYRDLNIEPGFKALKISYDYKVNGHAFDFARVMIGPAITPYGACTIPNATILGDTLSDKTAWTNNTFYITDTTITGLQRLYLYWQNGNYLTPQNPPIAIDNIIVEAYTCSEPLNVQVSTLDTSALVCWNSNIVGNPDSYTIAYKKTADSLFSEITINDTSFLLTGLEPFTDYILKVRTNCSGDDFSKWSDESQFKTFTSLASIPYNYSFEDTAENANWLSYDNIQSQQTWFIGPAVASDSTHAAYISNDNGISVSSESQGNSSFYRDILFDSTYKEYTLTFDAIFPNSAQKKLLFLNLHKAESAIVDGETSTAVNQIGKIDGATDSNWHTYSFVIHGSKTGIYRLIFTWSSSAEEPSSPCAIDNISITGKTVGTPYNLTSTPTNSTTYVLRWSSSNEEPQTTYTLLFKNTNDNNFTEYTTTDTFLTINNVIPLNSYIWKVKTNIGSQSGDWSDEYEFSNLVAEIPVSSNFEDEIENRFWQTLSYQDNSDTIVWHIGDAIGYESENSLYISDDNGISNSISIDSSDVQTYSIWAYRDIYIPSGYEELELSFDYKGGEQMRIFIGNPTADLPYNKMYPSDYIISYTIPAADQWTHKAYRLHYPVTNPQVRRIYIQYFIDNRFNPAFPIDNCPAIDNFELRPIICKEPYALKADSVGSDAALLSWTPGDLGSPDAFIVAYKTEEGQEFTLQNVTTDSCTLTGLQPDELYFWKVRPICNDSILGEWSTESTFVTAATLPYFCDFESPSDNEKWNIVNGSAYSKWEIGDIGSEPVNNYLKITSIWGTNSYYFYTSSKVVAYKDIYFDPTFDEYQFEFDFRGMGQAGKDYAKVFIGSPEEIAAGVFPQNAEQIGEPLCLTPSLTHYSFVIDSTHRGMQRLYFCWENNNDQLGANPAPVFDNIAVQGYDCGIPHSLSLVSALDTTATLSWDSPDDLPHNYTIGYRKISDMDYSYLTVSGTTCTIGGLEENSTYFWYVRTECQDGGHSLWSNSHTFVTVQSNLATLPYVCNFEDTTENANWNIPTGTVNTWNIGTATACNSATSLYVSRDGGVSNLYANSVSTGIWAWRDFYLEPGHDSYEISFDYKGKGTNAHYGQVFIGAPSIPSGNTIPANVTTLTGPLNNTPDWKTYTLYIDSTHSGIQRLYFYWRNNIGDASQPPAAIDNIEVISSDCARPHDLKHEIFNDNVILSWSTENAGQNIIAYRSELETEYTEVSTPDTFLILDNLIDETHYIWKVKKSCSDSVWSTWSREDMFVTYPSYPLYCDFENSAESDKWHFVNGSQTNKWYIGSTEEDAYDNVLFISGDSGITNTYNTSSASSTWAYRDIYISPNHDTTYISFDYRCVGEKTEPTWQSDGFYDYMNVYVGDCVVPSGTSAPQNSIVIGDKLCMVGAWTNFTAAIPSSQSGLKRLFFYWRNDGSLGSNPPAAINNIEVSSTNMGAPRNLTSTVMDTAAFLSWEYTAYSTPESFTLQYFKTNDTDTTEVLVYGTTYNISNLQPNTQYSWRVRINYIDGNQSHWAKTTFRTAQNTAKLPYVCDFEDEIENAEWQIFSDNGANKWHIGGAEAHAGSSSLYVSNNDGVTNAYTANSASLSWACRDIYLDPHNSEFIISFDFKSVGERYGNSAADYAKMFIGPAVQPDVTSTTPPEGCIQIGPDLYLQHEWITITDTVFNVSETGLSRIYFLWRNDGSVANQPPAAIDNLSITATDCSKPFDLTVSNIDNYYATLNWQGSVNEYKVAYKLLSETEYSEFIVDETTAVLEGLLPDADYECKVSTKCNDTLFSVWSEVVTFSTAQNYASLPFQCTFENEYENDQWTLVGDNSNVNQWYIGDAVSLDGSSSLYVTNDNGVSNSFTAPNIYYIWAYRDVYLDENYSEYQLSFDYRCNGSNRSFANIYIGNCVKPSGTTAPAGAKLLAGNLYNMPQWTHHDITISSENSGLRRIFILWAVTASQAQAPNPPAAFDNINISGFNCRKPVATQTTNITDESATMSWTSGGSDTPEGYIVAFRKASSSVYNEISTTEPFFNISGLDASEKYCWKVKATCGNNDESAWSNEMYFTTNAYIATLPYICDFEDSYENNQWRFHTNGGNTNKWVFGQAVNNGGNYSMYISDDNGISNHYTQLNHNDIWAFRDIYIEDGYEQLQISFDFKGTGNSGGNDDFAEVFFGNTGTPWWGAPPDGTELVSERLYLKNNWTHYNYVISTEGHSGVQRIYFVWHSQYEIGNPPAAIDNLSVVAGTCGVPHNITVDSTSASSISFHFTPNDEDDNVWEVAITEYGNPVDENQTITVSDTFYTFTNLNNNTLYTIYIRTLCDEESFWTYISHYTDCGTINELPYEENFTINTSNLNVNLTMPKCWSTNTAKIDNFFTQGSLEFFDSDSYAATPEFDQDININDLQVSFRLRGGNVAVGVMTDPENPATFTPVDTAFFDQGQMWSEQTIILSDYAGDGKYIAFKHLSWCFVDDVVVDYKPSCPQPKNVSISNITNNSATINWSPNGNEDTWEIVALIDGDNIDAASTVTVTQHPYTINGLEPATSYRFYIRAKCSDNEASLWTKSNTFQTACDPVNQLPYVEDFNTGAYRPDCWTFPETYGEFPKIDYYGNYALRFSSCNHYTTAVTPNIEADLHQLSVRFLTLSNTSYAESIEIGVMSDCNDPSTFEFVAMIPPVPDNQWHGHTIDLANTQLTGTGRYVAFRLRPSSTSYIQAYTYIDHVIIDYTDNIADSDVPVLTASDVTDTTALLSWQTDFPEEHNWQLQYRKVSENDWVTIYTYNNSHLLTDLVKNTQYVARVAVVGTTTFSNECVFTTTNVGIPQHTWEQTVSIFPNPAKEYIEIRADDTETLDYQIFNNIGKLVKAGRLGETRRIILQELPSGSYLVRIRTEKGTIAKKVIKW